MMPSLSSGTIYTLVTNPLTPPVCPTTSRPAYSLICHPNPYREKCDRVNRCPPLPMMDLGVLVSMIALFGMITVPLNFPVSNNIVTHLVMSFIEDDIAPAGAIWSIFPYGIFFNTPCSTVWAAERFIADVMEPGNATVLFIPSGLKIFSARYSAHVLPATLGMISPATIKAAFVYPH